MKKTFKRFLISIAFILILLSLFSSASLAQIREVRIRVDGLACAFCAYGLEKKLKSQEELDSLNISLKKGLVEMRLKEDNDLDLSKIKVIVKEAGYTLRDIEITAYGYVIMEDKSFLFDIKGNPGKFYLYEKGYHKEEEQKDFSLIEMGNRLKQEITEFFKNKTLIKIIGSVHQHPDGIFGLSVKTYSPVEDKK